MRCGRALGVLVLVLSGGCGNGDALTKAEYVANLNAMCEDFATRERQIGEPQTVSDLVEKGPRVLDAFESAIVDEVTSLEAPEEIAVQANRLVEVANDQRDVLRDLIEAAKDEDLATVRTLSSRNEVLNDEANSLMRELGAEACA